MQLPLRVLQLLQVGGVDFLLLDQRGQQLGLLLPVGVEGGAGPREVGAQERRLLGPGRQLRPRHLQRQQVGAEARDALLVAPGQGAHEPVAADRVGRPLDGEQQAQVGQLAQLVQRAGAGGQGRTGGGQARLQLPEPPAALLDLLVGPLEDHLRLAELLAAQPHLELEALDVAQEALLLAAELRQVAGEGVLARADPLQPRVAVRHLGGAAHRKPRRAGPRPPTIPSSHQGLAVEIGGDGHPQRLQDGGRQVHDRRRGVRDTCGC